METAARVPAPAWAAKMDTFNTYLSQNLLGGPKILKMAWVINLHKFLTIPVVLCLMAYYRNFSVGAWVYLGLHGSYGLCWLLKHAAFPDPKWETKTTIPAGLFVFALLATYWVAPFLLISPVLGSDRLPPPAWLMGMCIALYAVGLTIMGTSDCQKHFTLKVKKGLITTGMFKYVRHPNYLGEMMLYASFALLARHWIPWVVLGYWWLGVFLVNMVMIDASLSRYPEWPEYKARTTLLLPWKALVRS